MIKPKTFSLNAMTDAKAAKTRLRASIAQLFARKSPAELKEAGVLVTEVFSHWIREQPQKNATRVALFHSLKDEICMSPLDELLTGLGITRFLPKRNSPSLKLEAGPGIYANAREMDIILVPGRAFDKTGRRLGRGGGHYDRCLSPLSLSKKLPILVGIALEEQIVPMVPCEDHDVVMDFICTQKAMYKANASE